MINPNSLYNRKGIITEVDKRIPGLEKYQVKVKEGIFEYASFSPINLEVGDKVKVEIGYSIMADKYIVKYFDGKIRKYNKKGE